MRCSPVPACLLALATALSLTAHAQTAQQQKLYAAEPYVIDHIGDTYIMKADGTGATERTGQLRVQSQAGMKEVSVLRAGFAANSQHVNWVFVRLHHTDGSTTETPVTGAIEVAEPVTREAPFYSDLKESQLPVRDLRVGDTVEWKVRIERTVAEAPNQFWEQSRFLDEGVVLSQTLELRLPKETYVNAWSPKYKPTDTTDGDQRVLHWECKRLEPTIGPAADAAKAAEKKRIRSAAEELDEVQGKLPDVAWTTFKSWDEVGAWYRKLEGDRMTPDAEIRAKVAQLTAGKTTEVDKAQAVYAYVATQIHYIGVAFGIGRYQPHSAADVLVNQYGDCKDKHTLLAAMLEAIGLHPDAVLIGEGIRFNEAVPSPGAFNHLITRVSLDGKPVWLDTTAETAPFGMLVYITRDRNALVVPGEGTAAVVRTPAHAPFPQSQTMQATGKLDKDGTSDSTIIITLRGDDEIPLRDVLRQISPAQYDELAKRIFASIGYAGTGTLSETTRPDDTTVPLKLTLGYKRVKAGDWDNLRIIPQLAPVALPQPDEKEPPVEAIALGIPRVDLSTSVMTLPEGWTAELPEAVHEKSRWATYDLTYSFKDGTLHAERRVEILEERVPQAEWKIYAKLATAANSEKFVQLVRHTAGSHGQTASAYAPESRAQPSAAADTAAADADTQMADAITALQQHDLSRASLLLDMAKQKKPDQPGLWLGYGYLAFYNGQMTEAAGDFDKEAKLHPSDLDAYRMSAYLQQVLKHRPEARAALDRWAEAAPDDPEPRRQQAAMALEDNHPAEAVRLLEPMVAHPAEGTTAKEPIVFLLGRAQLRAGQRDAADATLLKLLQTTDDPGMMNDTAFELADAGLELKAAEQATAAALAKFADESRAWTLDENLPTLVARTRLIEATWDTMGWILFREGQPDRAEQYIHAAWQGRQDIEVGGHLGELALAHGNKPQALTSFDLALASAPSPTDVLGVPASASPVREKVEHEAGELKKAGIRPSGPDGFEELQKIRTLPLGAGEKGVAEYKILIGPTGSIVRAEPTGPKQVPGAGGLFARTKLTSLVPVGAQAQLVIVAILNCHSGKCDLVLEP